MTVRRRIGLGVLSITAAFALTRPAPVEGQTPGGRPPPGVELYWPGKENPVWALYWVFPGASDGADGSGLELREVRYKGKMVLNRASLPVLNVLYDSYPAAREQCGGPSRSYRDWQTDLAPFEVDGIRRPAAGIRKTKVGWAVAQPGIAYCTKEPRTVLDHPGRDTADTSFAGVAVLAKPDGVTLMTQIHSEWYRYIQKWILKSDGTIEAQFGFTAADHKCTKQAHTHHAYWRLDFDIEGPPARPGERRPPAGFDDVIEEFNNPPLKGAAGNWVTYKSEIARLRDPATDRKWRIRDAKSGRGYEVVPTPSLGNMGPIAAPDIADKDWAMADVWALRCRTDRRGRELELDDGGARSTQMGNRVQLHHYIDGENIAGQDVLLWYRAGFRHAEGHGEGIGYGIVRVTLKPFGDW
jgi:hypothetical protein